MENNKESNSKRKNNYWKQRGKAVKLDMNQVTLNSKANTPQRLIGRIFRNALSRQRFHLS